MSPLLINCSQTIDLSELRQCVAPHLTVTQLPLVAKGFSGEEVALSIALGVAGNASYEVIKTAVGSLAHWLHRSTTDRSHDLPSIQISLSVRGTTIRVSGESNRTDVTVFLDDWADQFRDDS